MMGMDYLRLNRILAKPRDVPRLSQYDRRLLRFVVVGAVVYIAAVILIFTFFDVDDSNFDDTHPFFFIVLPIGLMLVLLWTTDIVPVFARVSIALLAFAGFFLSGLITTMLPAPDRYLFVSLAIYFLIVGTEAVLQLRRAGTTET